MNGISPAGYHFLCEVDRTLFEDDRTVWNYYHTVTSLSLAAVLIAISIPIFTSQLEKAREATDAQIFVRHTLLYLLMYLKIHRMKIKLMVLNMIRAQKTYTATVKATQTKAGWQTTALDGGKIGGQEVAAQVKGDSWTITGDAEAGTVTITPAKSTAKP